jgi:xanthine dehydrogenase YagR molybdenum-binding subunit
MAREVELTIGYDDKLTTVKRTIPDDEPPPWDAKSALRVVGKPVPRVDARDKVTGKAKYTRDLKLPTMLYGVIIRSPYPAAQIRKVDTSRAEKMPCVRAVHVLDRSQVRFEGHEVAAVAAETPQQAEDAARAITIEYEPGPFVVTLAQAIRPDAPVVMPGGGAAGGSNVKAPTGIVRVAAAWAADGPTQQGNIFGPAKGSLFGKNRGDVEQAVKEADAVVEQEFFTPVQTHSCLETHAAVAYWEPGNRLVVHCGAKSVTGAREELAEHFGLPHSHVQVTNEFIGGHFGTKASSLPYGALAAHLAKKARRPVKIALSRKEEHLVGGNRPLNQLKVRVAGTRDGVLTVVDVVNHGSAGAGFGAGASGPFFSIYDCANVHAADYDVLMNTGPGCAFRAPGHPQGAFALEVAIDMLCERLGQDPVEFRLHNSCGRASWRAEELRLGAERIGWTERRTPKAGAGAGPIRRGIGVANSVWYSVYNPGAQVEVQINKDGSVIALTSTSAPGGGEGTVIAQAIAEELGLEVRQIEVRLANSDYPYSPAPGGSKLTSTVTPPARQAAYRAKQTLLRHAARKLKVPVEALTLQPGGWIVAQSGQALEWKQACALLPGGKTAAIGERPDDYGGPAVALPALSMGQDLMAGVQFAEVTVDERLGRVTVEKIVAVQDCGRVFNPLLAESQLQGGIINALSFGLFEERVMDELEGRMLNPDFLFYKLAGPREMPVLDTVLLNVYHGQSSTDARNLGEPAKVATIAAVVNAIYNATGAWITELPVTPARVLSALEERNQRARV